MSKTWISIALISQFLLIFTAYYLFYGEQSKTPEMSSVPKDSLVNWKDLQPSNQYQANKTNMTNVAKLIKDINWKEIPLKPAPPAGEMHDKWIVITSINSPTADVKKIAGIEGWKVVVVGDTKSPADWRYPIFIFEIHLVFSREYLPTFLPIISRFNFFAPSLSTDWIDSFRLYRLYVYMS